MGLISPPYSIGCRAREFFSSGQIAVFGNFKAGQITYLPSPSVAVSSPLIPGKIVAGALVTWPAQEPTMEQDSKQREVA